MMHPLQLRQWNQEAVRLKGSPFVTVVWGWATASQEEKRKGVTLNAKTGGFFLCFYKENEIFLLVLQRLKK